MGGLSVCQVAAGLVFVEKHHRQTRHGASTARIIALWLAVAAACAATPFVVFGGEDQNLYKRLGVSRHSGAMEWRKAYRNLSRKIHPDKLPPEEKTAAEARFLVVKRAFDVLRDDKRRGVYEWHGLKGVLCLEDKICAARDDPYWTNDLVVTTAFYCMSFVCIIFISSLKIATEFPTVITISLYGAWSTALSLELHLGAFARSSLPPLMCPHWMSSHATRKRCRYATASCGGFWQRSSQW